MIASHFRFAAIGQKLLIHFAPTDNPSELRGLKSGERFFDSMDNLGTTTQEQRVAR